MRLDHLLSKEKRDMKNISRTPVQRKSSALHCSILRVLKKHLEKEKEEKRPKRGCSSAGRAPALQAGGQGFDSPHLHHGMGP